MRAPTPRVSRLDFINSAMSTAAARDSAADLPRTFGSSLASQRSARERLPEDSGEYFLVALSWKLSAYNRGSRDRDLRFGHMRQVEIPLAVRLNRVFCRNPVNEKIAGGQTAYDSKPERRWRHSVGRYDAQSSRNFSERPVRAMVPASIKISPPDYSAV
jgi:hypothetical protein